MAAEPLKKLLLAVAIPKKALFVALPLELSAATNLIAGTVELVICNPPPCMCNLFNGLLVPIPM